MITSKKKKYGSVTKPTLLPWFKNKEGMIQSAIFIHSDPGHANADEPRENEAKIRKNIDGNWTRKGCKSHFI